jgi:hypothetical protein
MALFDDIVNGGNLWTGLAIGAGALIVWPLIGPVLRPITKTAIKGGLIAYREAERLYNDVTQGIAEMAQGAQQEIGATTTAQGQTHVGRNAGPGT